jgi:hypothetical protein
MRRTTLMRFLAWGALSAFAPGASAVLCKYVDDAGNVTYSDSPVKGAKKSSCFDAPPVPQPQPQAQPQPQGGRNSSPPQSATTPAPQGGLPNVDPATQRRRDDSRRKILEDELAVEERALVDARKVLSDGEATRMGDERNYQRFLDRVQGLKDRVAQHERNVGALRQELSNLR